MFTGIVTDIGTIRSLRERGDVRFEIETGYARGEIVPGASVACAGACLTAVAVEPGRFAVDVSAETLSRTTLGAWRPETRVNLELSLALGDRLGGHLATGHVDAVGEVVSREREGDSVRLAFRAPSALAPCVAVKGSIAVDGVSLTVNSVTDGDRGCVFGVNVIPHTLTVTTLGALEAGDRVNLEIDTLARYILRMLRSPRAAEVLSAIRAAEDSAG